MKNRIFGTAIAMIAATNMIFVGAAAHATTYVPELVYTVNTDASDQVENINALGDKVIFQVADQLWVSDGTTGGTVELEMPAELVNFNIQHDQWYAYSAVLGADLYFWGETSVSDVWHIFKTDGTTISQVTEGAGFSNFWNLVARDGNLYAWVDANENAIGYTDIVQITPEGGITPIAGGNDCWTSSHPTQIQVIGTKLIYVNDTDESCDYGLWAYDTVTEVIEELDGPDGDLYADANYIDNESDRFYVFEGEMYYNAESATLGSELFATDGTADGTRFVADIAGDDFSSYPSSEEGSCSFEPQVMGGLMYFAATTANGDRILYKTDGTELGTEAAVTSEVGTFPGCDTYSQPPVLNGKLIIDFYADGEGYDMYATDGTDAGTEMLGDILPGEDSVCDGNCTAQVLFDDHVFFIANDNENDLDNSEIWVTDGTSAGTVKVSDFASSDAVGDDDNASLIVAGDNLFFAVSEWPGDGGDGNLSLYKIGVQGGLAETGVDASGSMWAGLGLLVAGVAVVATRRRLVK